MTESERRSAQRHRTFKAGKIILHDGASVIDCTVRNISASGAALSLPNAATVPEEFDLQCDAERRHCIVTWRRLDRMGVKFK
jgi:PilZ domain